MDTVWRSFPYCCRSDSPTTVTTGAGSTGRSPFLRLERLNAASQIKPPPTRGDRRESVEERVKRMRERLAQGGEVAQGVVRELFPGGVWLYPDPDGKRHLGAYAVTADPQLEAFVGVSFLIRGSILFRRYRTLPMCPKRT